MEPHRSRIKNYAQNTLFNELPTKSIIENNPIRHKLEAKYANKIKFDSSWGDTISYGHGKKFPLSRLFRYKEAFSQKLIFKLIQEMHLTSKDFVLDPFAGIGTTSLACMQKGIPSIGIEMMPVGYFVANNLICLKNIEHKNLQAIYQKLKTQIKKSGKHAMIPKESPLLIKAFDPKILLELYKWKYQIEKLTGANKGLFRLILLSVLEECSYSTKDGQFLRISLDKKYSSPEIAIKNKLTEFIEDIHFLKNLKLSLTPKIIPGDARIITQFMKECKTPNIVITSPPYLNRYDYTRSYALELCFEFVKNNNELINLRKNILRSNIECKQFDDDCSTHPAITEVLNNLNTKKLNNSKIPAMISAYFVDMKKVITGLSKILDHHSHIVMVVDNVRFEGEIIPVDLILSDFAKNMGFITKQIIVARYKGNSSQQMGKYGRIPVRESIIIWKR